MPANNSEQDANNSGNTNNRRNLVSAMTEDKSAFFLFLLRLGTLFSCVLYFVTSANPASAHTWYYRATISSAITWALRLKQRLEGTPLKLNRETLARIVSEDACHYVFFSMMFLSLSPILVVLMPLFFSALLHSTAFYRKVLSSLNSQSTSSLASGGIIKSLITKVETNQQAILRLIAVNEIMIFPIMVMLTFQGMCNIFIPFVYYRLLTLRFSSRRNPYTRIAFYEMRVTIDYLSMHQNCPRMVGNILQKGVAFVSRLAPTIEPTTAQ